MNWAERKPGVECLRGRRVLVIEDEPVVALALEALLIEEGAAVVGPAGNLEDGLRLAESAAITAAVLDVRLGCGTIAPVAEALEARGIPFMFYTGQTDFDEVRRRWPEVICLSKPATSRSLVEAIARLR